MMFTDFFDELFARFGAVVEPRAQLPGVTQVRDHGGIASIFAGDTARHQSKSMFFNQGLRPRVVLENNNAALGADLQRRRR